MKNIKTALAILSTAVLIFFIVVIALSVEVLYLRKSLKEINIRLSNNNSDVSTDKILSELYLLQEKLKNTENNKSETNTNISINKIVEIYSSNNKNEDKEKLPEIKSISWELSTEHSDIYGPYEFDSDLMFLFNDGTYMIVNKNGVGIKNGSIGGQISGTPIFEKKRLFWINRSGKLSLYDFLEHKIKWSIDVGLPSKIDLINYGKFILFCTPTNNNSLIHKTTGVISTKFGFKNFSFSPVCIRGEIFIFSDNKIIKYRIDKEPEIISEISFSKSKEIKNYFGHKEYLIMDTEKGIYIFDGEKILNENSPYQKYSLLGDSLLVTNG